MLATETNRLRSRTASWFAGYCYEKFASDVYQDTAYVRYSPSGAKIAFLRYDVNYNAQIWVMNTDGTSQTLVSPVASYTALTAGPPIARSLRWALIPG